MPQAGASLSRRMLNKVPEVTLYFWVIKILCTTVGETAADYMNDTPGFGLTNTTYFMGALLIVALVVQFRLRTYVPGVYWLAVVLISIFGTLITDNLVDNYGVALETTTIAFTITLAAVFAWWYASERTLSIHTIVTSRREAFYWLAVLFTFALGTAAGDLFAERLGLGFFVSALIFAGMIALVAFAHFRLRRDRCSPSGSPTSSHGRSAPRSATGCRSRPPTVASVSGPRSRASSSWARSSPWSLSDPDQGGRDAAGGDRARGAQGAAPPADHFRRAGARQHLSRGPTVAWGAEPYPTRVSCSRPPGSASLTRPVPLT